MAWHAKTQALIDTAREIIQGSQNPMTVRQVYYQLVSRQVIENNRSSYQAVSNALVAARKEGSIPWERIEDRLRRPHSVPMWNGLADFGWTVQRLYRRDVWLEQTRYLEVWLEKDALSGIFTDVLSNYGVTLNVGRGYDGWSSIKNAADRFFAQLAEASQASTILYAGDFDPSGEDMVRSLEERLAELHCQAEIIKIALTRDDLLTYNLPPDFTKTTDSRRAGFVAKYGDISVELDALPVDVLRQRLIDEVEARLDLDALAETQQTEQREKSQLVEILRNAGL